MRSKDQPKNQLHFLAPTLKEQLNPKHGLYLLADQIDWIYFEDEFKPGLCIRNRQTEGYYY